MNFDQNTTQHTSSNPPGNVVMGIIIFLAVMGVAVAGLSLVRNVRSPFFAGDKNSPSVTLDTTEQAQAAQRAENLKMQDTDNDAISDFDELYTYKTSPYLKDTDSDSFDDKTEVASGHDPNCPEGQNCFRQDLEEKPKDENAAAGLPGVFSATGTNPIDQALTGGVEPTPTQIRDLLRQKGMTDEQLSQFDDQTLLQTYKDSVATVKNNQETSPKNTTPTNSMNTGGTDYTQLTATQIRELAISSGLVTSEQLSKIDDATLKDLFLKSMNSNTGQ